MSTKITPVGQPLLVTNAPGYNSWSFVQTLGDKLVCMYSRGDKHSIDEFCRGVYARVSYDNGKTWEPETTVVNAPSSCESAIGKGLDENGKLLLWVRSVGNPWHHDLYRSADGKNFDKVAALSLDPMPMQITDVFHVPGVGLMSLWFAGRYRNIPENSWGTLVSSDNGATWTQNVIQKDVNFSSWPVEQSAVVLDNGRIFAVARNEFTGNDPQKKQFQLQSTDYGKTWTVLKTNIQDVQLSTPSLVYDQQTGVVFNYYFHRGTGLLKCRAVPLKDIWDNPTNWPEPQIVTKASDSAHHAGNVNVVQAGKIHYCTIYTGIETQTDIVVIPVAVP